MVACAFTGCTTKDTASAHDAGGPRDAGVDAPIVTLDAMAPGAYCSLPGSIVSTSNGMAVVGGGDASLPDLTWLKLPVGYCAHHFANVPETRQLRMSPSGDLFVASPGASTAGGERNTGKSAILVLPDDDHDGLADQQLVYMGSLNQVQGLTFANGSFYFQNGPTIERVPFNAGDRAPSTAPQKVTTVTAVQSTDHWPKVVDVAQDGTVYVTNGSDQGEQCLANPVPPIGVVLKVNADGSNSVVAKGFRNPIAIRCEADHDVCLVAELAKDGTAGTGGREKLVPVRQGDDWGFPCCASTGVTYPQTEYQDTGIMVTGADCDGVTPESVSFVIGHTPFGLDFETGNWQDPTWSRRVFVALHGDVGSYVGSRVVAVALDPTTGMPLPSSDIDGSSQQTNMLDFVTGWDDGTQSHGRATAVAFGNDGRLYVGDDTLGEIFWVAPVSLLRPM